MKCAVYGKTNTVYCSVVGALGVFFLRCHLAGRCLLCCRGVGCVLFEMSSGRPLFIVVL